MNFLIDAQLPLRLARHLRAAGHNVTHTCDLESGNSTADTILAELANSEDRVLVTKDVDFVDSCLLRQLPRRLLPISVGNVGNDELLRLFDDHLASLIVALVTANFVELHWLGIQYRS